MGYRIFHVDAFTSEPFAGNPAAVCLLPDARDERWMQSVAREMNLSETAFLVREGAGFHLRWFTPEVEVALCGHATLASAHILWEEGILAHSEQAHFYTRSGELTASLENNRIELNFPAKPVAPAPTPAGLFEALGVQTSYLGKSEYDYLLLLDCEQAVRDVAPDFAQLRKVAARGIIVTARCEGTEFDFVSRFFAPASGVDEDPVTGSAHCSLGPFWQARLGKSEMMALQVSARGGVLNVRIAGDRVFLGGHAVTILRGELVA